MKIRIANKNEAGILTQIAFSAKRHWNYPEEYFKTWENELTIIPGYIHKNAVFVAEVDKKIVGFYSIVNNPNDFYSGKIPVEKGFWLEHIFVLPDFHKKGIGTNLIKHAINFSKKNRIKKLMIFVDPNAEGFYKKMNALYKYSSPSSIEGRKIPVYEFIIK
ncbi:MAG: GNAT family N-acetyltransferase [Bacteroidales bacterium]|nr:GNAT family N-acetyltransferase [Bacteroidales bacterium]